MKKTFTYLLAFALLPVFASAQMLEIKEEGKTQFKPHAYLQLQGGAAYTLGEEKGFSDLISPAAALSVGYKFSPAFGMRLGASGWQAKGVWVTPKQVYDFNYVQGNLDLVLDLSSLFCGFNATRAVSPYLFAGGGYAYAFDNDKANELNTGGYVLEYLWKDNKGFVAGRAGLGVDFRLSNAVSLNIEGNANILSDHFNSKKADNPDWQFNALAGLKINLGKTYTKTEPVYYEPEPVIVEVVPVPPPAPAPPPPPPVVIEKVFPDLPAVHFVRGSARIDVKKYATELATILSAMREFDDARVELVGYCDHTGSEMLNDRLSLQRAEALKAYLVKEGIEASRMTVKGMGKDMSLTGQEAFSVKARRAEVAK